MAFNKQGQKIVQMVLDLRQEEIKQHKYGPWDVHYALDMEGVMSDSYYEFYADGDPNQRTVKQRVSHTQSIQDVIPDETLPIGTIKLVDVAEKVKGLVARIH